MPIYKNSRFTESYVYSDERNRDIVHLDIIQEPRFSPSRDDLLVEVVQGDRVDLIAERFYGNENLDWVILEANPNLNSIIGLQYGTIIRVPLPEKVSDIIG